ncbi:MAG: hypothetical protein M1524_00525 [Patescibacteria group bacterium]|nr:hypothetical protein [Patescibacteria group bacterium]
MIKNLVRKIATYSKDYKDYLETWDKNKLLNDWSYGLKFFFNKTFYRGRSDRLSLLFEKRACTVLDKIIGKDRSYEKLSKNLEDIDKKLKENLVNNFADRKMIYSTITFLSKIPDRNIINYSLDRIQKGQINDLFGQLDEISFVGDKLITFYFRDIDYIFKIKKYLSEKELIYLMPIDVWVRKISIRLKIITGKEDLETLKNKIIRTCLEYKVDPSDYNLGAWFVGSRRIILT